MINDKNRLVYSIRKKDVFICALKQFYENKIQILIGPALILFGFILRSNNSSKFMGALLIGFGVFYIVFPYGVLISNIINVKNQDIDMELGEESLHISDNLATNKNLIKLDYKNIYSISKDKFYVRITPQDQSGAFLTDILIPINKIKEGNLEEFKNELQLRIKNVGGGEQGTDKKINKGKIILSYELKSEDFKSIYTKEYYAKKIHIFYIIAFAVIAIVGMFINKFVAISFCFLCIIYLFYPKFGYKLKSKGMEGKVCIRDCKDGYFSIIGDNIKVKVKPRSIKIIEDNNEYVKYLVPIKKKYFRYIYKERVNSEQLNKFLKILPEESYEYFNGKGNN